MTVPDAVRPPDATRFFTYQNPHDYHPDWRGFYDFALERRSTVQDKFNYELDLKYGPDPNQLANVYYPRSRSITPAPLIVYFHGGRWREGHPAFYDHFAEPWVEAGAVFASCGYRLQPDATIEDSINDAVRAINWAASNAPHYGADPHRIVVAGHSSGGHLAAMATMTDWPAMPVPSSGTVISAILMSPPVDLRGRFTDDSTAEQLSPVFRITHAPERVVVSFGHPEPNRKSEDDHFHSRQGRFLLATLSKANINATEVALEQADHVLTAAAFGDTASPLFVAARSAVFGREDTQ